MANNLDTLVNEAISLDATRAAIVDVSKVVFSKALYNMCSQNACGNYGTNWMCPPGVGLFEELKARATQYQRGLLFQTVHQLEDSFDFEGMMSAKKLHDKVFQKILSHIRSNYDLGDSLALNVGACEICPKCTYLSGEKCRFPEKAFASVESYGIDVLALVGSCGIPYNNGNNTVSYVGFILFKD